MHRDIKPENILVKNDVSITLLEFSVAFDSYSRKIDKHWVLSLEESLAIFIKTTYRI
jgi:serine/threonine protein kinase